LWQNRDHLLKCFYRRCESSLSTNLKNRLKRLASLNLLF
jgi:hypothetical protein